MTKNASEHNPRFFCSWSGGKDSCLALNRALNLGYTCASLFTMIDETGEHSRSHGLTTEALKAQAQAMGMPLCTTMASWGNYEMRFKKQLARFKEDGILHGVFGDIDLEPHREWVERVCHDTGIAAHLPLWKGRRAKLVQEFVSAGFEAIIVVVNTKMMPDRFLGRLIDTNLIGELEALNVDACGENGEFHSFVYDGPLFKKGLCLTNGDAMRKDGYAFLPVAVAV